MNQLDELKFALTQVTPGEWNINRHSTPDYAPQHGIYADGAAQSRGKVYQASAYDAPSSPRHA